MSLSVHSKYLGEAIIVFKSTRLCQNILVLFGKNPSGYFQHYIFSYTAFTITARSNQEECTLYCSMYLIVWSVRT